MNDEIHDRPLEEVQNELLNLKNEIYALCVEGRKKLPKEHRVELDKYIAHLKHIDRILEDNDNGNSNDNNDNDNNNNNSSNNINMKQNNLQYYGSCLLYETNDALNRIHDMIEIRVIQGSVMDSTEASFISQLTALYDKLLNDIIPDLPSGSGVVPVENENPFRRLAEIHVHNTPSENNLNIFALNNEEIAALKNHFDFEQNIIKHGPVLVASKGAHKLNYMFLTKNYLVFANKELKVKRKTPITLLPKAFIKNNVLEIRDVRVVSPEAKLWCEAINAAINSKSTLDISPSNNKTEDIRRFEVLVTVKKVENLQPSSKNRPDNPFFFIGVGNPEHFNQDRIERFKSTLKKTRNPEFNQSFTLKLSPKKEAVVDIRLYSKVSGGRNDFSYGVINIPLKDLFSRDEDERCDEINAWFDVITKGGKEGRAHVCVELVKSNIPSWINSCQSIQHSPLSMHDKFTILEKAPFVYAGANLDVVAHVRATPSGYTIIDASNGELIYSLEKSGILRKEYVLKNDRNQSFAKCFHKMKTIRKRKLRMLLGTNEPLYSMEGGCFDHKATDNEVIIYNIYSKSVASIVFGDKTTEALGTTVLVEILDPLVDRALLLTFVLYAMKTLL